MVNALTPLLPLPASIAGLMMNKSLRARGRESSGKTFYGFQLLVIPGRAKREPGIQTWSAALDSGSTRRRVARNDGQENAVRNTPKKRAAVSGGF
jgi:hypothetical protein